MAKKLNEYLNEYKESHQHPQNILIHYFCVPLIMWSVLGLLNTIYLYQWPLSWGLIWGAVAFYIYLQSLKYALVMLLISVFMMITYPMFGDQLRLICVIVFISAWIGQFYGHQIEGKKPSFFKDLLFLLIGPVWVFKKIFKV